MIINSYEFRYARNENENQSNSEEKICGNIFCKVNGWAFEAKMKLLGHFLESKIDLLEIYVKCFTARNQK